MADGMVSLNAKDVGRAARLIRRADPEAWKALRVTLKGIGVNVAMTAKANVSYSTQIPPKIKVGVAAGNVRIYVTGDPGVAIENKGKGFVRHPVFGRRDRWTAKNSKPAFLLPAFAAKREESLEAMERAYLDTFVRVFERG